MPTSRRTLLKGTAATAALMSLDWTRAQAQGETVRIGTIYDLSGPFAAGGSVASSVGTDMMSSGPTTRHRKGDEHGNVLVRPV